MRNIITKFIMMTAILLNTISMQAQLVTVFEIDFTSTYWSADFNGINNSGKGSNVTDKNGKSYWGYSAIKPTTEITAGSTWTGYLEFGGTGRFFLLPEIGFNNGGEVIVEWGTSSNDRSLGLYFGSPNTNTEDATGIAGDGTSNVVNYIGRSKSTFGTQTFTISPSVDGSQYLRLSATSASSVKPSTGSGIYIKSIVVKTNSASSDPILIKTSGENPASAKATVAMDPVVYTYNNVEDAGNVFFNWYTDNTYTSTTSAPTGLSIDKDTGESTVTVSGTPAKVGTYYYKIWIDEEDGNNIEGSIEVEALPLCTELRLESDFTNGLTNYTFSSGDILHGVDVSGTSVSLGNRQTSSVCAGAAYRVQFQYVVLELKSTNINQLTLFGTSSGSSVRNISKLEIGNSFSGSYDEITNFNVVSNSITTTSCGELIVDNLNIPAGSFVRFTFSGNVNFSGFDLCTESSVPTISLSSGDNPTSAIATLEITPVVYSYSNVEDSDHVLYDWYTDNTYTSTASAPSGLSIDIDTDENTVTVSGTPTTAGTYYYMIEIDEEDGNAIYGSIVVDPYVTPTPQISLTSGSKDQQLKAGAAIDNIVYTLTYADGASVTGLPSGLSGNYDEGVYTISGTVNAEETPGAYNFTVTADPWDGYTGDDVSATGTILVKSATAYEILYLTADATPSALDTKLYPMLDTNVNYIVTVKQAAGTAPAASSYDAYDLIVLNESVNGTNAEALAVNTVDKPILNLKSYVYTTGRWGWGTPDNGKANNGTVKVKQPAHPIFTGLDLSQDDELILLSGAAVKGVQPADVTLAGGINVAEAPKTNEDMAIAIHDVPADKRGVANSKYLMIALCNDSYDKMTADALQILDNAVNYLISGNQFDPLSVSTRPINTQHITFNGSMILNANQEMIQLFDMSGRLILTSNQDINMNQFNKGIYIVRSENQAIKIALTK